MSYFTVPINIICDAFLSGTYLYTTVCYAIKTSFHCLYFLFADEIANFERDGAAAGNKRQLKHMLSGDVTNLQRMCSVSESEKKEEKKVWPFDSHE